jgi:hypothetical protein
MFKRIIIPFIVVLALLAAFYMARGSYFLLIKPNYKPVDLRLHAMGVQYVLHGQNPYDVLLSAWGRTNVVPIPEYRSGLVNPDIGTGDPGVAAAWSYPTMFPFLSWPWPELRVFYSLVNCLALALIGVWVYRAGKAYGKPQAILMVVSVLAMSSICRTLGNGQFGIIVLGLLICSLWRAEQKHFVAAGLLLGMALAKPHLAGLFPLVFIAKRQVSGLVTTCLYVVVASLTTWAMIQTDPLEMTRQMLAAGSALTSQGHGVFNWIALTGIGGNSAMFITAGVTAAITFLLLASWRKASWLTLFAIAGVGSRLWTYHRDYDDLVLMFLMLALGLSALARHGVPAVIGFLLMGFSLWPPGRVAAVPAYQIFQCLAWVACLGILLAVTPRSTAPDVETLAQQFNKTG